MKKSLHESLRYIYEYNELKIESFLNKNKVQSMLSDLSKNNNGEINWIIKSIEDGSINILINSIKNNSDIEKAKLEYREALKKEGMDDIKIEYLLNCFSYGFKLTDKIETLEEITKKYDTSAKLFELKSKYKRLYSDIDSYIKTNVQNNIYFNNKKDSIFSIALNIAAIVFIVIINIPYLINFNTTVYKLTMILAIVSFVLSAKAIYDSYNNIKLKNSTHIKNVIYDRLCKIIEAIINDGRYLSSISKISNEEITKYESFYNSYINSFNNEKNKWARALNSKHTHKSNLIFIICIMLIFVFCGVKESNLVNYKNGNIPIMKQIVFAVRDIVYDSDVYGYTETYAEVRKVPSYDSEIIRNCQSDEVMIITGKQCDNSEGVWYELELSENEFGWILSDDCTLVYKQLQVTPSAVNLRMAPSLNSGIYTVLYQNQVLNTTGVIYRDPDGQRTWYQVIYNNDIYWISSKAVRGYY